MSQDRTTAHDVMRTLPAADGRRVPALSDRTLDSAVAAVREAAKAPRPAVPLTRQIAAVEREVKKRQAVYPRLVAGGKMTQAKANDEIAAMEAVLDTLKALPAARPAQGTML